ncbi:choice-of-anchor G family protein [Paeniglutamicibacter sp. R2-26]|uniref:choice-of-anchor G family protein n=1 Tax=Paeniglutamicibacter sp. R2-26 TaxID=3144417 RepID=UPI003EE6540E
MTREKHPPGNGKQRFSIARKLLAGAVASSLLVVPTTSAYAAPADLSTDQSEALGQVISSELLSLDLLETAISQAGYPTLVGPNSDPINLSLLELLGINVGTLALPVIDNGTNNGLLNLGSLGTLNSFGASPSGTQAKSAAGAVTSDGAVAVDPDNEGGGANSATIDLTALLDQLNVSGLTDQIVDEVALKLGAVASTAEKTNGNVTSEYVVADAKAVVSSPLVGNIATQLGGVVDGADTTVNGLVGSGGVIDTIVSGVPTIDIGLGVVDVNVGNTTATIDNLDLASIKTGLLQSTITASNGVVSLDLGTGLVTIDLEQAVNPGATNGLNGLAPNTDVIDTATLQLITTGLENVVSQLVDQLTQAITDAIYAATLNIEIDLSVNALAGVVSADDGSITISGSLGDFLGINGGTPDITVDLVVALLSIPLINVGALTTFLVDALVTPILSGVGGTLNSLISNLDGTITPITDQLLDDLSPVINGVLNEIVQLTINDQPTVDTPARAGALGAGSFSVSALTLTLLPQASAAKVSLATSSVRALDAVAPAILANPASVVSGQSTTITGEGYPATTSVAVQLTDASDNPVGSSVNVTTDGDGKFSTPLTVPAGTPAGTDYKVVGSVTAGPSASTPLTVTDPSAADNTADNTAVNTADNAAVNTADNSADNTADNTAVNTADNAAVNTADNAAVNTADNTAVNTAVNTADNAAVNTADNAAVNTADNAAVNTADNTAVNTADNAAVNTADNAAVNTADNAAVNTADNAAVNTADNTAVNTADNAAVNTADNAAVNTADNAAVNTADNAAVNTADNAAVNTADNTAVNTADNTADNTEHANLTVIPGEVEQGDSAKVIGDQFTGGSTVTIEIENVDGSGEKEVLSNDVVVGDNGTFVFDLDSSDIPPGVYEVTATDTDGKTSSSFLVVRDKNASVNVSVDVTPKRVVKGEPTLLNGWGFTADGTAEVSLIALTGDRQEAGAEVLESDLVVDADGKLSLRVDTESLELGDYLLTAKDNSSEDKDFAAFTVVAKDDSTAENTADNTDANTDDNTDENTDANMDDNSDDNTDENTDENSSTNVDDNSSVNSGANNGDNTGASGPVRPNNSLAKTGAEETMIVTGIAVLLLLGGVATLMASRKRRAL